VYEGDIVDDFSERSNNVIEHLPPLPVPLELPGTGKGGPRGALKEFDGFARIPILAVFLFEQRLVVEGVDMTRRSRHEKLHDSLRFRRMVQRAG